MKALGLASLVLLAGCGGGGPLGNPPTVENAAGVSGRKLSFAYFQKCIQPVLLAQLQTQHNGVTSTNTCASGGCHDSSTGTGGALRVVATAAPLDLATLSANAAAVRASDMYKNFYSAQGVTVPGNALQSRLLAKPLLLNVLHGGGLVFSSTQDANARLFDYWINHPMPQGQDEFSSAAAGSLFTPNDVVNGACNSQ